MHFSVAISCSNHFNLTSIQLKLFYCIIPIYIKFTALKINIVIITSMKVKTECWLQPSSYMHLHLILLTPLQPGFHPEKDFWGGSCQLS